jgi:hypothetical protein
MSTIETVYDTFTDKVAAALTGYARIANPYDLADNPDIILRKGYGVAIGPGTNTERFVGCIATWEANFVVGIILQVASTENNVDGRSTTERNLLEGVEALLIAFENDPSLSGNVIKAVVNSHSGIQYIPGERGKYVAIEIDFTVEYLQTLS